MHHRKLVARHESGLKVMAFIESGQMVDIPLSKKGWVSTITTILLSPIMAGFLNALGADVYQASKTMAFDTQTPYSGYPYENIVIAVNVTL